MLLQNIIDRLLYYRSKFGNIEVYCPDEGGMLSEITNLKTDICYVPEFKHKYAPEPIPEHIVICVDYEVDNGN